MKKYFFDNKEDFFFYSAILSAIAIGLIYSYKTSIWWVFIGVLLLSSILSIWRYNTKKSLWEIWADFKLKIREYGKKITRKDILNPNPLLLGYDADADTKIGKIDCDEQMMVRRPEVRVITDGINPQLYEPPYVNPVSYGEHVLR